MVWTTNLHLLDVAELTTYLSLQQWALSAINVLLSLVGFGKI